MLEHRVSIRLDESFNVVGNRVSAERTIQNVRDTALQLHYFRFLVAHLQHAITTFGRKVDHTVQTQSAQVNSVFVATVIGVRASVKQVLVRFEPFRIVIECTARKPLNLSLWFDDIL